MKRKRDKILSVSYCRGAKIRVKGNSNSVFLEYDADAFGNPFAGYGNNIFNTLCSARDI